ncbi:MAG TPA: hypothetical protein V6C57_27405 [Coleofasciculaceae cyanobacterium]
MSLEDMSIAELFALSDEIGDRYLTPEEIAQRNAALQTEVTEIGQLAKQLLGSVQETDRSLAALKAVPANAKRRFK